MTVWRFTKVSVIAREKLQGKIFYLSLTWGIYGRLRACIPVWQVDKFK